MTLQLRQLKVLCREFLTNDGTVEQYSDDWVPVLHVSYVLPTFTEGRTGCTGTGGSVCLFKGCNYGYTCSA